MKFSLVITLLNEGNTIKSLLCAIGGQSRTPDEILLVDGGSEDNTINIITKWARDKKNIKIFSKKGFNIAQGRNFGIIKSIGSIIVLTDAGCIPHKDWFENITSPFINQNVDIVSGFYRMTGDSSFQKCVSLYFGNAKDKINSRRFLPSARSMAFKKDIWKKIGGFDEKLKKAGEDTIFNYSAVKLGARFYIQNKALVDWELPNNIKEAIYKFYFYALGDIQTNIWWHPEKKFNTHNLKIMSIYIRYIIGSIVIYMTIKHNLSLWFFLSIFLFYILWAIKKNYNSLKIWQAIFWLPIIQFVSDFSIMLGFAKGLSTKILKT